jgi:hypothetical protein
VNDNFQQAHPRKHLPDYELHHAVIALSADMSKQEHSPDHGSCTGRNADSQPSLSDVTQRIKADMPFIDPYSRIGNHLNPAAFDPGQWCIPQAEPDAVTCLKNPDLSGGLPGKLHEVLGKAAIAGQQNRQYQPKQSEYNPAHITTRLTNSSYFVWPVTIFGCRRTYITLHNKQKPSYNPFVTLKLF